MKLRAVKSNDAAEIAAIYNEYVLNSIITFETESVSADEINERIEQSQQSSMPWVVAESESGAVLGYAYASKWKGRCAYALSVEVTVYISSSAHGKGVGSALYKSLFEQLKTKKYHVAIAGISLPNEASIRLHEKFGMKKVAHFEEIGFKFNQWIDVGYWQVVL